MKTAAAKRLTPGHGTGPLTYREVFFAANGFGPFKCFFCNEKIADKMYVHHIDGNELNHDPENLASSHPGCHTRHHLTGHTFNVGRPNTPEQRRKISEAMKGRTYTAAHRAAISAGRRRHLAQTH